MDYNRQTDRTTLVYNKMLDEESKLASTEDNQINSPALRLEVELENGKTVYITPHPDDKPEEVASRFCQKHNLDTCMINVLAESIKKSIEYSQQSDRKEVQSRIQILTEPTQVLITQPYSLSCKANQDYQKPSYLSKKSSVLSQVALYDKGIIFNEQHRIWIEKQKKYKQKQQTKECTHIPKINKLSRSIASQKSLSLVASHHDKEIPHSKTKLKVNSIQSKGSVDISYNISKSLVFEDCCRDSLLKQRQSCQLKQRNPNKNNQIFLNLYENKKSSQSKKSKTLYENSQETYHPLINEISKQIVGKKSFTERMANYQQQKLKKKEKIKENKDKENLYTPKIGPPPQNRNVNHLPIGQFLYNNKKKKAPIIAKPPPAPIISESSKKIYEERKQNAFKIIFEHLDFNRQGIICWNEIDLHNVNSTIMPILLPLLQEIQIMQIELNLHDFKIALNYLFSTLSPAEKNILLNFHEDQPCQTQITPKSKMSKKSKQLIQHMNRRGMSIYDYCQLKQSLRQEEMQIKRIEKEKKEMEECTFQPKIQKKIFYF